MTNQERFKLEQDYDALNKNGRLEKTNISREDYVNTTDEIRTIIIKNLIAQDVINYYNNVKDEYTSKIKPIDRTNDVFYNYTCKKNSIFKKVLRLTKKRK